MNAPIELSKSQAKKIILVSQGLHKENAFGTGIDAAYSTINRLSYIQIDSISVVQRAHHHSMWSRVGDYHPDYIEQLIKQKQVFEYWSHAAAYLPMDDYRFSLPKKHAIASGERHWRQRDQAAMDIVLDKIRQEGPLQARDFEASRTKKGTGWWDWKPAKVALEQLFIEGELMVVARRGFQKVYDITERVLPAAVDTSMPTASEFDRYLITRYLKANAFGTASEIGYLRKGLKKRIQVSCDEMLEEGELVQIKIAEGVYYALADIAGVLNKAASRTRVKILSPFDNLVIQRKRLSQLFGFEYQIECYVPPPKRQYGYFCLPLLWGQSFAGRMDTKIDRKTSVLHIQNLCLETTQIHEFIEQLSPALKAFKEFNGGTSVKVKKISSHQKLSQSAQVKIKKALETG